MLPPPTSAIAEPAGVTLGAVSWPVGSEFPGRIQSEDKTLYYRSSRPDSRFILEFLLESSEQPLHIIYVLDTGKRKSKVTYRSYQGDHLEIWREAVRLPNKNCPTVLPSELKIPDKALQLYQYLIDAGALVKSELKLNNRSIIVPTRLFTDQDRRLAYQRISRVIANASPSFVRALGIFADFISDKIAQAVAQDIIHGQVQRNTSRMVPLDMLDCMGCIASVIGVVAAWASFIHGPTLSTFLLFLAANTLDVPVGTIACLRCFQGSGDPSDGDGGGGGGCGSCTILYYPIR